MTRTKTEKIPDVLTALKNENINTWFDLGLFIDRLKERESRAAFKGDLQSFNTYLEKGGIAFFTFQLGTDGFSLETVKHAKVFKAIYPTIPIHFVAGRIEQEAITLLPKEAFKKVMPEMEGSHAWPLYTDFFKIKMERGSTAYNNLIGKFWKEVLTLVEKLGSYMEEHHISLLYLNNVCATPANVSLALAIVLISEYLGIPVMNHNHDFYWEGGHRKVEIKAKGLEKGSRDFFFHNAHVGEFFSLIEMLYPWESRSWMNVNTKKIQQDHLIQKNGHNPANIAYLDTTSGIEKEQMDKQHTLEVLQKNMHNILKRMHLQLGAISNGANTQVADILKSYRDIVRFENEDLHALLNTKTRHYLPGYGRLSFMLYLKSLIDPSFFRVEEQLIKGKIMRYAKMIAHDVSVQENTNIELIQTYYNTIDAIFKHIDGELSIRHDHALAYRHRNKKKYAYQDFTYQEITGLVHMIYHTIFKSKKIADMVIDPNFSANWEQVFFQDIDGGILGIDNREMLTEKLKSNAPKGYFPGPYLQQELDYFVLQPIRSQLQLHTKDKLTAEILKEKGHKLAKTYVFIHRPRSTQKITSVNLKAYLEHQKESGLAILFEVGLIQIITTEQWSEGVHFPQMGATAIKVLRNIKESNGYIITHGEYAAMMADILEIDQFHIGKVLHTMTAKIMGVPKQSGFIQFVPAGVRTTLAYPTPIQTAKDFDNALKSQLYKELKNTLGEKKLLEIISLDAIKNGTPITKVLEQIQQSLKETNSIEKVKSSFAGGVYEDGLPWSGVLAEIDTNKHPWKFAAHIANTEPKNVPALINEYKQKSNNPNKIELAWNGGYILNPELVGKLGLPETYIGSPLGLLIMDNKVFCPPLFNKPAFIIYKNGAIDIRKVNSKAGFNIKSKGKKIVFTSNNYNRHSSTEPCFYDLSYTEDIIQGNSNVILRIAGNTVKQIIKTKAKEVVSVVPVGITLSIPTALFSDEMFTEEMPLDIQLLEPESNPYKWNEISYAIEAGPMLIHEGKQILNMEDEGWKTSNSIKTQAARLDFTDMRGPKIAVGITKKGKLMVLMVNGRIRESVGATHFDMVDILLKYGMDKAMGFDPGGSSTLVVDGNIMNISPYNKNYEKDIYALPPEPRFVANAIMGWIEA